MNVKLNERQDKCKCGGWWRLLYEKVSPGGGGYPLVRCHDGNFTTGLFIHSPTGTWRLEHQSKGAAEWRLITKNDEVSKASF